jgi:hypothetical protein
MAVLWTHGVKATLSSPRRQTLAQGPGGINSRRGRHIGIMPTVVRVPIVCSPNPPPPRVAPPAPPGS